MIFHNKYTANVNYITVWQDLSHPSKPWFFSKKKVSEGKKQCISWRLPPGYVSFFLG